MLIEPVRFSAYGIHQNMKPPFALTLKSVPASHSLDTQHSHSHPGPQGDGWRSVKFIYLNRTLAVMDCNWMW